MNQINQNTFLGKKILIIGCAGAGKTTLAKQLAKLLNFPIIHLDKYYWNENWGAKSDDEWEVIVNQLCQQSTWVMDGNYTKTIPIRLQYASSVIYLDMPRWKCLLRAFIRRFRIVHNRKRKDIPSNCKERLNFKFYQWIWNYPKRSRHKVMNLLQLKINDVYHLKSNHDVSDFIEEVKRYRESNF